MSGGLHLLSKQEKPLLDGWQYSSDGEEKINGKIWEKSEPAIRSA